MTGEKRFGLRWRVVNLRKLVEFRRWWRWLVSGWQLVSFIVLLFIYLGYLFGRRAARSRFFPQKLARQQKMNFEEGFFRMVGLLDRRRQETISRVELIEIAIQNMRTKRTRTLMTVGGMAVGIGAIVFLVSLGYGLQELVISRVARLEEMKQTDVVPQTGSQVKINDGTLADLKELKAVDSVLPMIAVVGRVSYQSSITDMAVYGVTTEYLEKSAIQPTRGEVFDSSELVVQFPTGEGEVAGAADAQTMVAMGERIGPVDFSIEPDRWVRVRAEPGTGGKILGYTKRAEGIQSGEELWGSRYPDDEGWGESGRDEGGQLLGRWIKAPVLLWEETGCQPEEEECEAGGYRVKRDEDDRQVQAEGYFAHIGLQVTGTRIIRPEVLGISDNQTATGSAAGETGETLELEELLEISDQKATDSSGIDWVAIASEAGGLRTPETLQVSLGERAYRQAVVNEAMLEVLGVAAEEAVGKKFDASFVVVGDLLAAEEKIESNPAEYEIVAVIPEGSTPLFYVPFIDLRSLGVVNYSQFKLIVAEKDQLAAVRQQVEAMGLATRSVVDTVAQINSMFSTLRTVLALLGMVALVVASLGMFNTLTVSLLERTREVGLMKALGMTSSEIKELFLTESILMGFFGGFAGIIFGFAAGKLLGVILSAFSVIKGAGYVDVAYLPAHFTAAIVLLSFLVGVITGFYPAKRATRISALNALRYE